MVLCETLASLQIDIASLPPNKPVSTTVHISFEV